MPTKIIADGSGAPAAVAVSTKGIVAALNICSGRSCSEHGNIAFYAKSDTAQPCAVVSGGVAATPLGGAFDDKGRLYVVALNSGGFAAVAEIRGGCNAKVITPLKTVNMLSFPSSVQVDRNDRIVVLDLPAIGAAQIDIYAPPTRNSSRLRLQSTADLLDAAVPIGLALTADGRHLWVADAGAEQAQQYPPARSRHEALELPLRLPQLM